MPLEKVLPVSRMNDFSRWKTICGFANSQNIFRTSLQWIVNVLIIYIILILVIGLVKTLYGMKIFLGGQVLGDAFNQVVTDILSFLVIIELFRGFIEYFEAHRFRLHTLLSPSIVFILRELIIKLYSHENVPYQTLAAFGFVILCLGVVRALAVHFTPSSGDDRHEEHRPTCNPKQKK